MPPDPSPYRIRVRRGNAVTSAPSASVIVLVTHDATMLLRCLRSLDAHLPSSAQEIVVVANGTPPAALRSLASREDIVLIHSPINHGFAGGCNLAVRFARAERLVFINDDVEISEGWLEGLHAALDADAGIAVAGSRVVLSDGRLQEAGSVLWNDGSTSGVGRGRDPAAPEFAVRRRVDYVSFCSAVVRRAAWEEVGGFDERYFPAYYEDLDLCLAVQRRGWTVVYEPSSLVQHAEGGSASRDFRDFLSRRNQYIFVAKWGTALADYEAPPSREDDRPRAVERALRRAASRPVPPNARRGTPTSKQIPAVPDTLDDVETLTTQVRVLSAALAVHADYINTLRDEASALGLLQVIKRKLYPRRMQVKSYLHSLRPGPRSHRGGPQR